MNHITNFLTSDINESLKVFDNVYFRTDEKSMLLKPSLYIPIIREPFSGVSDFKSTASFKQFLDGSFDYPNINMFEFSSVGQTVIVENILFIDSDPETVRRLFKNFFNRYLNMENDPIDAITGSGYEEWRKDIIKSQCNHSFIKQLPRYPSDDRYRFEYMNVQC